MPFYRYTGQDTSGKAISGALDATSPDTAYQRLTGMGLGSVWVEGASPGSALASPPTPAAPRVPVSGRPVSISPGSISPGSISHVSANPVQTPRPVASNPATATRTANPPRTVAPSVSATRNEAKADDLDTFEIPIASHKERSFFFDQFGRFINSGVAPTKALDTLGDQRGGRAGEFLRNASRKAGRGTGIGESLRGGYITEPERDALTASERGGYVPQACARLSDLAMDAHRMGRGFAYPVIMICLALFAGPCTRGAQDGSLKAIEIQDRAGGSLSPVGTLMREWGKTAPTTIPLGLLFVGLFLLAIKVWNLPFNRRTRHALSMKIWPLGPRARSEATSQLSSHLAALSNAGIAPNEAARLSAATIPNLSLRREAMQTLGNAPIGVPLSQTISRSSLVSMQYRDMVANGELTGDVPGALSMVARVEEGEYINRSKFAGKGLFVMLTSISAILIGIYLAISAKYWYSNLIELLTRGE